MARIKVVEPQNASPEVKEIYSKIGSPINVHKALALRPEILKGFIGFYPTVGKNLDKRLYELIYIRTSMINGCHY